MISSRVSLAVLVFDRTSSAAWTGLAYALTTDSMRAQVLGTASPAVITVQGLGTLVAGVVADAAGADHALVIAGVAAIVVGLPFAAVVMRQPVLVRRAEPGEAIGVVEEIGRT